jgi:hypothetical protein
MAPPASEQEEITPEIQSFYDELTFLEIKPLKFNQFDIILWDIPATSTSSPKHLQTYFVSRCADYMHRKFIDGQLLSAFCEDFEDWNETMFTTVPSEYRRILKTALRYGGVYTGRNNGNMGKQLAELLRNQDLPKWDDNELTIQKISPDSMWYQRYDHIRAGKPGILPLPRQFQTTHHQDIRQDSENVVELGGRAPQDQGRDLLAGETAQHTITGEMRGTSRDQQGQRQ